MNPRLEAALDKGHNPPICLPCGDNAGGKWIGDGRAISVTSRPHASIYRIMDGRTCNATPLPNRPSLRFAKMTDSLGFDSRGANILTA
jgi:hypothetical protein